MDELVISILFTDYYRVYNNWDRYTYHCSVTDAQCDLLDYHCVCHCYPGYVMVNGTCLKGQITISHEYKNIKLLKTNVLCLGLTLFDKYTLYYLFTTQLLE